MLSLLSADRVTETRPSRVDDAASSRTNLPAPPINGALPSGQPVMPARWCRIRRSIQRCIICSPIPTAPLRADLLQVASLWPTVSIPPFLRGTPLCRLEFRTSVLPRCRAPPSHSFRFRADGAGQESRSHKRVWRARFSLDVDPAGAGSLPDFPAISTRPSVVGGVCGPRALPPSPPALRLAAQRSQSLARAELQPARVSDRVGWRRHNPRRPPRGISGFAHMIRRSVSPRHHRANK